jgi:hypothetical protein
VPPLEEQWHNEFAKRTASAARELIVRDAQDAALTSANATTQSPLPLPGPKSSAPPSVGQSKLVCSP